MLFIRYKEENEVIKKELVEKIRIDDINHIHFSCYDDKDKVIEKGN